MKEMNFDEKWFKKKIRGNLIINIIVYILYLIASIVSVLCLWAKSTFNVGINEIVITLAGPLEGAGTDSVKDALLFCIPRVLLLMGVITAFYVYVYVRAKRLTNAASRVNNETITEDIETEAVSEAETEIEDAGEPVKDGGENRKYKLPKGLIITRRVVAAASPLMLAASLLYVNNSYGVAEYVSTKNTESTIYEQYYVDPNDVDISIDGEKKNLIQIYVESLEISYASVEDGGMQQDNLMPNLTSLAKNNVSFNNTDGSKLGGFYSNYGATWTFGALYTSLSGVPYNLPVEGNAVPNTDEYAIGLTGLGEILEDEGYYNEFLCGSDANFAGRKQFLKTHGNYEIYDYYAAIEKKVIPPSYYAWWGFEDQKLYSIAKDELNRLADAEEPFNFTMLTADTHFPDGYGCELCGNKYDEFAANVVDCTDRQLSEFVEWIMEQPFYENSVIVIMGDHPRMDTVLVEGADWNSRRIYNCIINGEVPEQSRMVNREFSTYDMFPTVLAALGYNIEGNRLGLGTNLYSNEKTLSEQIPLTELEPQLAMNSDFYLEKFAPELLDEDLDTVKKKIKHVKDKKALKKIKKSKKKQERERLKEENKKKKNKNRQNQDEN